MPFTDFEEHGRRVNQKTRTWTRGRRFFRHILRIFVLILVCALLPQAWILGYGLLREKTPETVKPREWAIVLGTSVQDGEASPELQARLETAAALYKRGKVRHILCSGDNLDYYYDEPLAIAEGLMKLGIPEEAIVRDPMGLRTYDSIWRAKEVYQIHGAIICSQAYHAQRALCIAQGLGMDAEAVASEMPEALTLQKIVREFGARYLAFAQAYIVKPSPTVRERVPLAYEERDERFKELNAYFKAHGTFPEGGLDGLPVGGMNG